MLYCERSRERSRRHEEEKAAVRRPTIEDVAARAGVSRQTVSRVLNDKGEISAETRERVLSAIEALGYRPNAAARSMVMGRTSTLGCITPNLLDYTLASIVEGAQSQARREGFFMLTGSAPNEDDAGSLLEELLRRQVDGLLVLNPHADERYRLVDPLLDRNLPIVYAGNSPHGRRVGAVRCDDHDGGRLATRYLIGLGHRAVATILGPANEECVRDRLAGYREALSEVGLPFQPALTAPGDWSADSGYRAARQILAGGLPFTALFAQNDLMAVGAIRALRESGLETPGRVSVIGFDDIPLASFFDPPLTTVHQSQGEIGHQAARLLIEAVQDPAGLAQQVLIQPQLVERTSCLPPPSGGQGEH
jgi:DNA-binding LacI/PurR family transcriptional regulator